MRDALTFILSTLLDLYIITFVLRLILQWVRADFSNPLTQFILRITNPLVIPLRRMIPAAGSVDTATLLIVFALVLARQLILLNFACLGEPAISQILLLTLLRLTSVVLLIYLFVILIYVLMSWISPGAYNPATSLLASIAEPVLKPLRRFIPSIGGLDLSPLFALIGIQALTMVLPRGQAMSGIICSSVVQLL
jgi:YggT family protein